MSIPLGLLPKRDPAIHKGQCGHLLVVAGSRNLIGAASLCVRGALRSGAGLVTLAVPEELHAIMAVKLTEAMFEPLPQTEAGSISEGAVDRILKIAHSKNVLAIGPGLSQDASTQMMVRILMARADLPLVMDADALNAVADRKELFLERAAPTIVTPHPGEMARLLGMRNEEVLNEREAVARSFARECGVVVVLKGFRTLVADPRGQFYENATGNPGMATGGCGDVLTGVISGLLAQGLMPYQAACLGTYLHGLAADIAAEKNGQIGLLAGDIPDTIPTAIRLYQEGVT